MRRRAVFALPLAIAAARARSAGAAEDTLRNGAPFLWQLDPAAPRETVRIVIAGGPSVVPADRQGVIEILQRLLLRRDLDETRRLFLINADLSFVEERRCLILWVIAPPDHLREVLEIARAVLERTEPEAQDFALAQRRVLDRTAQRNDNPDEAISWFALRAAFGDHPDVFEGEAPRASVARVSFADVQAFMPQVLDLRRALWGCAGPLPPAQVKREIEAVFFPAGRAAERAYTGFAPQAAIVPHAYKPERLEVTVLARTGVTNNQIRFIFPDDLPLDGPDRAVADVAHQIVGGGEGALGRLGVALRIKRGLTYHAATGIEPGLAWFAASFGGIAETPGLLRGMLEVLAAFKRERLRAAEVSAAAAREIAGFKESEELASTRLRRRMRYRVLGWDPGYIDRHEAALAAVTPVAVHAYAAAHFDLARGFLTVLGDPENLLPALEAAGFARAAVRVLDADDVL